MTTIHIEGMGWLGSALAHALHRDGIDFTWHDIATPVNSWQASTGMVYPAGDARSTHNLHAWHTWANTNLFPPGTVTPCAWAYINKKPPYKANHTHTNLGWANIAHATAYAVDAPAVVNAARHKFAHARREAPPNRAPLVRAHGFHARRTSYIWGWSAPVRLHFPANLTKATPELPVALYGRAHRWAMAYAYPIPSRPGWHWAGSSLVRQGTPRYGNITGALERWKTNFTQLFPRVEVKEIQPPAHGWRPKPDDTDPQHLTQPTPEVLEFPPLWHSGIRWAPQLVEQAVAWCAQEVAR